MEGILGGQQNREQSVCVSESELGRCECVYEMGIKKAGKESRMMLNVIRLGNNVTLPLLKSRM